MRRVSFSAPYGDFWVDVYEGRLREATRWEDIAGKRSAAQFIEDLDPEKCTREEIAECMQIWAGMEGNDHGDTNYLRLADQLLMDWRDEVEEARAEAEGDA